jgi:hypothetical protein
MKGAVHEKGNHEESFQTEKPSIDQCPREDNKNGVDAREPYLKLCSK